jgi:hypothetical protein
MKIGKIKYDRRYNYEKYKTAVELQLIQHKKRF